MSHFDVVAILVVHPALVASLDRHDPGLPGTIGSAARLLARLGPRDTAGG